MFRSSPIAEFGATGVVSPLMEACQTGDTGTVESLLAAGSNPNDTDPAGKSAFFYIVSGASPNPNRLVELLAVAGGSLNTRSVAGQSFVDVALQLGKHEVIDCVIRLIDASTKEGKNTIGMLIRTDNEEVRAKLRESLGSKHFKYFDNKFRKKLKKAAGSMQSLTSSCKSLSLAKLTLRKDVERGSELSLGKADKRNSGFKGISVNAIDDWLSRDHASHYLSESNSKIRGKTDFTDEKGWGRLMTSNEGVASPENKGWLDDDLEDNEVGVFTFKTVDQLKRKEKLEKNNQKTQKVQSDPKIAPWSYVKPDDWLGETAVQPPQKDTSKGNSEVQEQITALLAVN
jgi:hypothetical protein